MHIFFSGIGGAGIGPLALVAKQAGYEVSGSDKQSSEYLDYLRTHGINDVHVGQSRDEIAALNDRKPIDWFVYSSALTLENAEPPELKYCQDQAIRISKRDELINQILSDKKLNMIAIAGTHGKTTTTAMVTYLFKKLNQPISYLLSAKTSFAELGEYDPNSQYFIYEADEFDRNFLAFEPDISLISGVSWDHHEIFPTREDYQAAFTEFISQSNHTLIWQDDADYLKLVESPDISLMRWEDNTKQVKLKGQYNRLDAFLAIEAVRRVTNSEPEKLIDLINDFPGLSRRMELVTANLYSDYAHTPEKIRGAMSVASEMADQTNQNLIVIYEPLTNRRQHYMLDEYRDVFSGAARVYWVPSYLAREDPTQRLISPEELISHLSDPSIARAMVRNDKLKHMIEEHLDNGDMVVGMAGGGGGSLDDWLRKEFKS